MLSDILWCRYCLLWRYGFPAEEDLRDLYMISPSLSIRAWSPSLPSSEGQNGIPWSLTGWTLEGVTNALLIRRLLSLLSRIRLERASLDIYDKRPRCSVHLLSNWPNASYCKVFVP